MSARSAANNQWWLALALAAWLSPASAQTFNCQVPVPTLKDQMIQESITRYPGNCPCPYHRDARGRRCGKRSACDRAGGYTPLCFPEDISADMVREFCEVLKMRGQGSG
jgi:hypothetical protein